MSPEVELFGPDGREVHVVQVQMSSSQAPDVLRADRLYPIGDLLGAQKLGAGYSAPAYAVHPGRGALEREQRRALELLLGAVELLFRDELFLHPAELLGYDPHGLLDVAGRGTDVGLDGAGVGVALVVGVEGVGEPTLLPHLLEEATAHPAAEHAVQGGHGV